MDEHETKRVLEVMAKLDNHVNEICRVEVPRGVGVISNFCDHIKEPNEGRTLAKDEVISFYGDKKIKCECGEECFETFGDGVVCKSCSQRYKATICDFDGTVELWLCRFNIERGEYNSNWEQYNG